MESRPSIIPSVIFFYLAWILTTGLTPLAAEQPIFSFSGGRPNPISLEIFEADRNLSIRIVTRGEREAEFDVFTLPRPARLVVDLRGIRSALRNVVAPGNSFLISAIRFGSHPDKLRIVFDLKTVVLPAIEVEKKERTLVVELRPGEEGAARAPETPAAKPTLAATATATFQAPAPSPAPVTPAATALPPATSGQPAGITPTKEPASRAPAAIPTPVPAKTKAPTATRTAAPPASASATKTVTFTATATATATATKTISPAPTSTETVTPTRTSTATNTALPTHTATPTHSTAPVTMTPTVTPPVTPAVQPAVTAPSPAAAHVARQALTGFTFETSAADGAPLIVLNMTQRPVFRLSRKDERTYTLTLTSSALGAEHLRLPQFPPQNFAGFTFISAEPVNANVEVTIGVERNVRLVALAKENSVLLRVAAK